MNTYSNTHTSVSNIGKNVYLHIYDNASGELLIQVQMQHRQTKELISGLAKAMIEL